MLQKNQLFPLISSHIDYPFSTPEYPFHGLLYPDDYPNEGGDICVVGVFDTYQEGDYTYCTLRNAKIV